MIRATARFFLIGAALLGLRVLIGVERPPQRSVEVVIDSDTSETERRIAIDKAILFEEGLRLGWLETDPVIRRRLVMNMLFIQGEDSSRGVPSGTRESALFNAAIALEMHRTDAVVKQRIIARAKKAIERNASLSAPSESALQRYFEKNNDRFVQPPQLKIYQVFLSRQSRGEETESAARKVLSALRAQTDPREAHRRGDPFPHAPRGRALSATTLNVRFGRNFGKRLTELPLKRWSDPIASAYGLHLVWIDERIPGKAPELDDLRSQVQAAFRHDGLNAAYGAHLSKLRPFYEIHVREALR